MNHLSRSGRQVAYDVLVWLALSVLAAASGPDPLDGLGPFVAVTGTRVVLLAAAVAVGRAWPVAAVVLITLAAPWDLEMGFATLDLGWLPGVGVTKVIPMTLLSLGLFWYAYLAGRQVERLRQAVAAFAGIAGAASVLVLAEGGRAEQWIAMVTGLLGTYAVPYLIGGLRSRLRTQRARAQAAAESQARLRERTRIAHDMHDSLGHDLALIAVRAAGLELSPGLTPAQVKAAGELRVAAADATERLRQIIGLLREQGESAPLDPVGGSVAELVERARASGMEITLRLAGEPPLAHRVVQEGLTNAAKHAPGALVTVTVGELRVSVVNGAPGGRATAIGGGTGLTALRERVRLAGGILTAGPRGDGYELTVELPRAGEADPRTAG
ncbi:sensor histidine kinase [Nonomuraea endophytica]|uniref:histidine kinase n=1 Tax=Nonomuraea endophytica TaxID=714136 RepID=A0A7W8EIH7_9ACTN|nr:histidine kinase [Nonomuraea endophytica]MBB5079632.1 signal transduction histidine kinase [Nonomuraea endophytica]